jgi:branched-chain amino acid transport system substrate-binding protein
VAKAMHTLKVTTAQEPGILMDVVFDANGDLDRESFLTEVKGGKQVVVSTLPPLNPDAFKAVAAKPVAKAPAKK